MSELNPNEEQNRERFDDAVPTQMMPDTSNLDGTNLEAANTSTSELRIISFYLPSRSEPLISRETTITIGRRDPKRKISPTIDLTEERGAQLGVSRLHVEINFQNGRYYLKDMGSANGTWVNNSKLVPYQPHPIETGDQIRLGQLALLIHITMPQRSASSSSKRMGEGVEVKYTVRLLPKVETALAKPQGGFAPALLNKVSLVLKTVEGIHAVVREAQKRAVEEITVVRVRTNPNDNGILLDLSGGADVMTFLVSKLPSLRNALQGSSSEISDEMQKILESAEVDQYPSLAEKVAAFALQELAAQSFADKRKTDVQQLAQQLTTLMDGELQIVPGE